MRTLSQWVFRPVGSPPPRKGSPQAAVASPERSVEMILDESFRGALLDLESDPNAFLSYMAKARDVRDCCIKEMEGEKSRCTKAMITTVYKAFSDIISLLEKVVHVNGYLVGSNMALKACQASLREEVVQMVISGVKGELSENITRTKTAVKEAVAATVVPGEKGYAAAVKGAPMVTGSKKRPKPNPPVVLVFPDGEEKDSKKTKAIVKESLRPQEIGVQVKAVRTIRDGGLAIETNTREQLEKVKAAPSLLEKGFKVQEPRVRGPRLLIYDVPEEEKTESLAGVIWSQNFSDEVEQEVFVRGFKVIRRNKSNTNMVVECSGAVRNLVRAKGRIFIGWGCCRVVDFVFPLRCNRCYAFGHTMK